MSAAAIDLFRYQDAEVRVVVIDGEPWFVTTPLIVPCTSWISQRGWVFVGRYLLDPEAQALEVVP